ncbi:MAG TPA: hypothetical protein VMV81_04530, partial [Phycisphaerae bacterium]|nr:hypothetical protein [Phycisphaerae bacterium]
KSSYERPRGIKFGSFVGLMPYEEQFGLRMPYWRSKVDPPSTLATGGRIAGPATFRNWQIPCWLVALGLLLICTINFLLDRPIPENICVNCRYDLTGNASGVCPECGTARPASGKSKCAA